VSLTCADMASKQVVPGHGRVGPHGPCRSRRWWPFS